RIVVTRGLELRQRQRTIVKDRSRRIVRRNERLEFSVVARKAAVHVESGLAERDDEFAPGRRRLTRDQIEQRRVHALKKRCRWPQSQRNLFELEALAELGGRKRRVAAIGIALVEATIGRGEELLRRQKPRLRQQRPQQPGGRAGALVKFRGRGPQGRDRAGGLAAGEADRPRHGIVVEAKEPPDRGGSAEWPEHARAMPALAS